MHVLQDAGRIALAKALAALPAHFAWGRGDGAWVNPPATPSNRNALMDEICRRQCEIVGFVVPGTAANYEIQVPRTANPQAPEDYDYYNRSAVPTPWLYLKATFGFGDATGETVREAAVFFDSRAKAEVPPGQRLLWPQDIEAPGFMYCMRFRVAKIRDGASKPIEEMVIPL